MKITLAATLRHYDKKNFIKDLLAGIIIMAVSIPISMVCSRLPDFLRSMDCMVRYFRS